MRPSLLTVRSRDLIRAEQFYGRLGVAFVRHSHGGPEHLSSESDGMVFEIYPLTKDHLPTSSTRLGFEVNDLPSLLRELEAAGEQVVQEPRSSSWGLRAVVRDGDGHCVELIQAERHEVQAPSLRQA